MSRGEPTTAGAQGARDQVSRLLTLVPFLHARGQVRLDDAAVALGVSPAQLVKDLKVLLMCGLPGGYPNDLIDVDLDALEGPEADGVIRVSNADYLARPLRLTATEATAVIVALRALRGGARDDTREVVDRALAKLEAAAADGADGADGADPSRAAATRVEPGEGAADADIALLATRLVQASRDRRQVRLTYYVPSRDEDSLRDVDPRGVVASRGVQYLDAWCHLAEAPRLFRLDRIGTAEVLDVPIVTEAEGPRDLAEGLFARTTDATVVTLLLDPPAHWMVEYYPVEEVTATDDGRLRVQLVVADPRWLTRLLLRLAPHARVVAPQRYADDFTASAQRTLGLYS
ncbi:MAG: WYL domain-containing protein [Nocardioides sp.]|nr:WYL domain-containing protein [Nocardioides sp.]